MSNTTVWRIYTQNSPVTSTSTYICARTNFTNNKIENIKNEWSTLATASKKCLNANATGVFILGSVSYNTNAISANWAMQAYKNVCLSNIYPTRDIYNLKSHRLINNPNNITTDTFVRSVLAIPVPTWFDVKSFYTDATHSVIDYAIMERNKKVKIPYLKYINEFQRLGIALVTSSASSIENYAKEVLLRWCKGGGILLAKEPQDFAWNMPMVCKLYLLLIDNFTADESKIIINYLYKALVIAEGLSGKTNNLGDALGFCRIYMGMALDDIQIFNGGITIMQKGLSKINAKGQVHTELARGDRAFQYTLMSLKYTIFGMMIARRLNIPIVNEYKIHTAMNGMLKVLSGDLSDYDIKTQYIFKPSRQFCSIYHSMYGTKHVSTTYLATYNKEVLSLFTWHMTVTNPVEAIEYVGSIW